MSYKRFSLKAALELVSPPTWVASVGPCCIAGALALAAALVFGNAESVAASGPLAQMAVVLDARSVLCWVLMLFCAVLLQSATNTLNDYQDFKSGLDTSETILDETDASIVYNQINPRHALVFALVLLGVAGVLGILVVLLSSVVLLVWGLIAAAVVVLYSAGPKPISSLPLGEVISGVVMGGIITGACFYAMTLSFSSLVIALSVVPVIGIAQIMQTNNTCDVDRDITAGRKTLPVLIGRKRSSMLNAALCIVAFVWLGGVLVWAQLYLGLVIVVAGFALCLPKISRLLKDSYSLENRRVMMGTIVSYNKWLDATTVIALLLGGVTSVFI